MDRSTAQKKLEALMKQYDGFGARDSKCLYHFAQVVDAAEHRKPFPLKGHNPWELYESVAGWEQASAALTDAAMDLWMAIQGIDPDAGVQGRGNDRKSTYVVTTPREQLLETFFQEVAMLTVNHATIGDSAVVYPSALGEALARVDPDWWNNL